MEAVVRLDLENLPGAKRPADRAAGRECRTAAPAFRRARDDAVVAC
ncbi:hypothetical protein ACRAWD_01060 [Caulobacter segnis]